MVNSATEPMTDGEPIGMQLECELVPGREICHFAEGQRLITSRGRRVYVREGQQERVVTLPAAGWKEWGAGSRLWRRAARLDKCNVIPVDGGLVIIRQGRVYHYDLETDRLAAVLTLSNCRNVLHQSVAVVAGRELFFGEYGTNAQRGAVPVYRSADAGRSWERVYIFEPGQIKHVHGCYWDPYDGCLWTLTGDFDGECRMLRSDRTFQQLDWIGDGSQVYRACNVFFEPDAVYWIMDSHLQTSYQMRWDRKQGEVTRQQAFAGPVWYIKRLEDGYWLAATAQEVGAGVRDEFAHLMISRDLRHWEELAQYGHDGWPKGWFKFGVIGFADGRQRSDCWYMFMEALEGLDGKVMRCGLVPTG